MKETLRVMSAKPLNAETLVENLRSWITANSVFFERNQGAIPPRRMPLTRWRLVIEGEVEHPLQLTFQDIRRLPKGIAADTLECSGNGRSLLTEKAAGNPWTIGGVGNAVWGGIWLRDLLAAAGLKTSASHSVNPGSSLSAAFRWKKLYPPPCLPTR
jgi:DMSO/TMAO reductase YedYZ molybdopterin-dependent catalytic subunit